VSQYWIDIYFYKNNLNFFDFQMIENKRTRMEIKEKKCSLLVRDDTLIRAR
jgi:hypothetical protein